MSQADPLPRQCASECAELGCLYESTHEEVQRLDAEVERLRKIEEVFNDGWLPELPGEQAVLRTSALYHLRTLIPEKTSV